MARRSVDSSNDLWPLNLTLEIGYVFLTGS